MKKALPLTLAVLFLGGIGAARMAWADDAEARLCRQAVEEVKKTQEFMQRAAPRILACADDSAKAIFARARHTQAARPGGFVQPPLSGRSGINPKSAALDFNRAEALRR